MTKLRDLVVGVFVAAAALIVPGATHAQDIRGTVVEANDSTVVPGAVVLLMHATRDSIYSRIITGERGIFTLRAPVATPVRLRVLRLGYQPTNAGTYTLALGQTENVRVKLGESRVVLASFDVASTNRCDVRPDSAMLVAQLYEEARKALIASATPMSSMRNQTQFALYTRVQDLRGKLLSPIQRNAFAGPSSRPFASLSADSLAKVGYVVQEKDGTVYRAPDADVLLADSFLQSHCLQLVNGIGERSASIGIGFKPVGDLKGTRELVDVKGTLWLDRESNELQSLEYQYVGVPDDYAKAGVGGRVDYTQMAAGLWFVNKWAIRMPFFTEQSSQRINGLRGNVNTFAEMSGVQINGGEVQWLKADDDILYSNTGALLAGSEPRDMQDLKVTQGEFEVESGASKVTPVTTVTGIDSVFTMSSCVAVTTDGYTGQVQGRVRDLEQRKFDSLSVVAEWKEDFRMSGRNDFVWQFRRLETRADASGNYVFCGLPLMRAISLSATNTGRKSRVAMVKLTAKEPRTSMNISIGSNVGSALTAASGKSRGSEVRVIDAFGVPIAFATVTINGTAARVADKDGQVFLNIATRDSLRLTVRRIGFKPFDGMSGRDSSGAFQVTLAPIVQNLKTVTVNDRLTKSPLELNGFYDRAREVQRGAFRGEFFTPEDLNLRPSGSVGQFLAASRYLTIGRTRHATVAWGRAECAMAVVIDGIQVLDIINLPPPGDSIQRVQGKQDINDLASLGQISAIEVYPSASNAPASITSAVRTGTCGIVAIWTGGRGRDDE